MSSDVEKSRRVYQILGLRDFAGPDEIKKAYREMALLHHPDKNREDPEAADRFKTINAAYQLLSNEARKATYDSSLAMARAAEARLSQTTTSGHNPYAPQMSSSTAAFVRTATQYNDELNAYRETRRSQSQSATQRKAGTAAANGNENQPSAANTSHTAAQAEMFRKREKEREREVARKLERERDEKREKEMEKVKRMQASRLQEEDRRKREQEKLREKIDRIFGGQQQAPPAPSPVNPNLSPAAAQAAAEIRGRAASSAAAARAASANGPRQHAPPPTSSQPSPSVASPPRASHPYDQQPPPTSPNETPSSSDLGDAAAPAAAVDARYAVERQRDERIKQQESRQRAHEKQIEARLQQLRSLEERRLAEEMAERNRMFEKRSLEIQTEEQQERVHYIVPHETHERSRIATQLKRIVKAYDDVNAQQHCGAEERHARHHILFLYTSWSYEMLLWRKQIESRAAVEVAQREARTQAVQHFHSVLQVLTSNFLQLKALATEYEYHRGRIVVQERNQFTLLVLRTIETTVREATVLSDEAEARRRLQRKYWDHKVAVMLEVDEVRVRRNIIAAQEGVRAHYSIVEREERHRVGLLAAESANFIAILKRRAEAGAVIHRSLELTIDKMMVDMESLRAEEAKLKADLQDAKRQAALDQFKFEERLKALSEEHDEEVGNERRRTLSAEAKAAAMQQLKDEMEGKFLDVTGSYRAAMTRIADLERQLRDSREDSAKWQDEALARVVAVPAPAPSPPPPQPVDVNRDEVVLALRKRIAELEAKPVPVATATNNTNRELVQMLCAENQRLLEANAKLLQQVQQQGSVKANDSTAVAADAPAEPTALHRTPTPSDRNATPQSAPVTPVRVPPPMPALFRAVPAAHNEWDGPQASSPLPAPSAASPLPAQRSTNWRPSQQQQPLTEPTPIPRATYYHPSRQQQQPSTPTSPPSAPPVIADGARGDGSRQVILARAVARNAAAVRH